MKTGSGMNLKFTDLKTYDQNYISEKHQYGSIKEMHVIVKAYMNRGMITKSAM